MGSPCVPEAFASWLLRWGSLRVLSPHQRSSDGSLSHEEDLAKVMELQEVIDKQAREQSQMKERLAALSSHVAELEEDLDTARKDLIKSEEVNTKLQRDVREVSEPTGGRASIGPNAGVFWKFDCLVPFDCFVPDSPNCFQPSRHCLCNSKTERCCETMRGDLPVLAVQSPFPEVGNGGDRVQLRGCVMPGCGVLVSARSGRSEPRLHHAQISF